MPIAATPDRALIERVGLFRGLNGAAHDDVLRAARIVEVPRGAAFFRQEAEAEVFYVMIEGRAKVVQVTPEGRQIVVHYVNPGEMFGFVAVFGESRYPGTAEAMAACRALAWNGRTTSELMMRHPRIALNALKTLGARLREIQERYRELSTERVERRIARAVLRLALQAGKPTAHGTRIDFPLSRQDLAELTGTTLYTVSRTLSAWEARGLVETGRRRVIVRNPEGLAQVAESEE